MQLDASAIRWSKPEGERAAKPLVVLIHGYSGDENTLFDIFQPAFATDDDGVVVASLRGDVPTPHGGYAWFLPGERAVGEPLPHQVDDPATAILEWLDTLDFTSVSLISFSQGGLIALQLLRHAPARFAATAVLGSCVGPDSHPGDAELEIVRPPVFFGIGDIDEAIPELALNRTYGWLPGHTTPTLATYPDIGHAVSPDERDEAWTFVTR